MRRKMKTLENNSNFNLCNIRDTIKEINEQREFKQMQKNETIPILNPVFQSVQIMIGKKKAQEVKTFSGNETVTLNSQLFDIPLMDEEVESHKNFQNIIKNNSELLEPSKFEEKIKKLENQINRKQKININIEDKQNVPQILLPPGKSIKRKQEKQNSIINRIMRKEKALRVEQFENQTNLQKKQLKKMKKQHITSYENKLIEQRLRQSDEILSKKCSQSSQGSCIIKKNNVSSKIILSPTIGKQNLLIENFPMNRSQDQQMQISESVSQSSDQQIMIHYFTEMKPSKQQQKSQSVSNTPIQRQEFMKQTLLKLNSEYQRKDSKEHQKNDNQMNMNITTDFTSTLENLKKRSSMQQQDRKGVADSKRTVALENLNNGQKCRSSSVQTLLESLKESKQGNSLKGNNEFRGLYFNENDNIFKKTMKNNNQEFNGMENKYQDPQIFKGSNSESNLLTNIIESPLISKIKQQNKVNLDDSMKIHIQKIKIRDQRLNQVKKKLGLIDQESIKQEQILSIQKSLEQLQQDQELEKQNQNKKYQSPLRSNNQPQKMLTFSHNTQYNKLKSELLKQKDKILMIDDYRNETMSYSSSRIKSNRSSLANDYFNMNNDNEQNGQKNILSTSRSHRILTNQNNNQIDQRIVALQKQDEVLSQLSSSPSVSLLKKQNKQQTQLNQVFQSRNNNTNQLSQNSNLSNEKVNRQINRKQIQGSFHLKTHFTNSLSDVRGYKSDRSIAHENKIFTGNYFIDHTQQKQNPSIGGQNFIFNLKNQKFTSQTQSSIQNVSEIMNLSKRSSSNEKFGLRKNNINQTQYTNINQDSDQMMRNSSYNQTNTSQENSKQLNNTRIKLFSNHVKRNTNKNIQNQYNHSLYSQQNNLQKSFQSISNYSNSLIQAKQNTKSFFKEKTEFKKEFGEKITEVDKDTQLCKQKVHSFVDGLIDYSDQNKLTSRRVSKQMKQNFSKIKGNLLNWKKELIDDNSNFEKKLIKETLNFNKNLNQVNMPI